VGRISTVGFIPAVNGEAFSLIFRNVYNSYASGTISGNTNVGGLVGNINGDVINSYWDVESTGQGQRDSDEGTGLTTSEMTGDNAETNMVGFDFNDTWNTTDMYPILIDNNIVE